MTLPTKLRSRVGTSEGDLLEAAIDARLAKTDEDIKHGRTYGPFNTAEEMAASIEANIKRLRAAKKRGKPAR
jgi:hypothetical protein